MFKTKKEMMVGIILVMTLFLVPTLSMAQLAIEPSMSDISAISDKSDDIMKKTDEIIEKQDELSKKSQDTLDVCSKLDNKPIMTTSGTEYGYSDNAKVFVRLLNGNSRPINSARCNTTLYFPNNTKFIDDVGMSFLEKGYYYHDFITPNISGVYILGFDCLFPSGTYTDIKLSNYPIGASPTTYTGSFPFDNDANMTINSAWIQFNVTGGGGGANNDYYFNEQYLGSGSGVNQVLNYSLNQSRFNIDSSQDFTIVRTALSSVINSVRIYVNYTSNDQLSIIRGQNEIHIKESVVNGITLSITEHDLNLNSTRSSILSSISGLDSDISTGFSDLTTYVDGRFDSVDSAISGLAVDISGIATDISNVASSVWSYEPRTVTVTNTTNYVNTVYDVSDDVVQKITDSVMNSFIAYKDKLLTVQFRLFG